MFSGPNSCAWSCSCSVIGCPRAAVEWRKYDYRFAEYEHRFAEYEYRFAEFKYEWGLGWQYVCLFE